MIIDGKDAVFGRLGTQVAKKALLGEKIDIINCEKILISGKREVVLAKYERIKKMGVPKKGPFLSVDPEKFVKRQLRGMLPYKQEKGREAFERIKCYEGVPKAFEGKDAEKIAQSKLRINSVTIEAICKHIGGNK
ncbi:50S ribosomal protein L13 [Candidatus Woesearchaeota archaeon]|nr:50S ribosomal protein L13 [Candidatus Woesearchaeota archaeon]